MDKTAVSGFTLIEVVLAIAVGLIIIAGVSVGYGYAKRAAIIDNERKTMAAVKTFVEQAITAQQADLASNGGFLTAPVLTFPQIQQLAKNVPSLRYDPFSGVERSLTDCALTTTDPCIGSSDVSAQAALAMDMAVRATVVNSTTIDGTNTGRTGSAVNYLYASSGMSYSISIILADGTTKQFYGYAVTETDEAGKIVAADGGTEPGQAAARADISARPLMVQ